MRYITAIRMGPGSMEEHVVYCLSLDSDTGRSIELTPKSHAELILENGLVYKVASSSGPVDVEGVKKDGKPHHIRTVANSRQTDNLLNLPRF